jgi:hypothetical protein
LDAKLTKYFDLQNKTVLLEALKDIDSAQIEPIKNSLIPEYKLMLEKEKYIKEELRERPHYLERLQSNSHYPQEANLPTYIASNLIKL